MSICSSALGYSRFICSAAATSVDVFCLGGGVLPRMSLSLLHKPLEQLEEDLADNQYTDTT